jgi:Domain of unknown function (DUF4288)
MGYVPTDAQWFIAELVMEITVRGAAQNVVHRNLILVHGTSAEDGFRKATDWGYKGECSYENPRGQTVEIKFRGISKFDEVLEELEDGAELTFEESKGVDSAEIDRWIPPKDRLDAFRSPRSFEKPSDPDYSSRDVVNRMTARPSGADLHPHRRPKGPEPKAN